MNESIVLVGMNIRLLTRSAVRAGCDIVAIGVVGFLDMPAEARSLSLMHDLGGIFPIDVEGFHTRIAQAARNQEVRSVAYSGGFENFPDLVAALGNDLELLGNSPATLRRVRDPFQLKKIVASVGMETPQILPPGMLPDPNLKWLRKPIKSGAGSFIGPWEEVVPDDPQFIVQQQIEGIARSASFIANGKEARVFAHAEQLSGDPAFGAQGFQYVGNLLVPPPAPDLIDRLNLLATTLTQEFGLVGLNGIDYIIHNEQFYVLEVNPRYSASMELAEEAIGQSLFPWHINGCRGLPLPEIPEYQNTEIFGKATVLAKQEGILPDTTQWLDRGWHDVAYAGQPVFPRYPLCTISARGRDFEDCYKKLVAEADELYGILDNS